MQLILSETCYVRKITIPKAIMLDAKQSSDDFQRRADMFCSIFLTKVKMV